MYPHLPNLNQVLGTNAINSDEKSFFASERNRKNRVKFIFSCLLCKFALLTCSNYRGMKLTAVEAHFLLNLHFYIDKLNKVQNIELKYAYTQNQEFNLGQFPFIVDVICLTVIIWCSLKMFLFFSHIILLFLH